MGSISCKTREHMSKKGRNNHNNTIMIKNKNDSENG